MLNLRLFLIVSAAFFTLKSFGQTSFNHNYVKICDFNIINDLPETSNCQSTKIVTSLTVDWKLNKAYFYMENGAKINYQIDSVRAPNNTSLYFILECTHGTDPVMIKINIINGSAQIISPKEFIVLYD